MNILTRNIWLLMILALTVVGCDQVNKILSSEPDDPNLKKIYYDNGVLKAEIRIDGNKNRHGITRQYYASGKLKSEFDYEHGTKLKAVQYYENGNMQMEFYYREGLKHGPRGKFWEDGTLSSELQYENDNPGALVEYNKSGKQITKYPSLIVQQVDYLESRGEYWIEAYFSSNPGRGTYYRGELENGFLPNSAVEIARVYKKGRIVFKPRPGTFMMNQITIVGKYKTAYGNPYLVQKTINVAFDY